MIDDADLRQRVLDEFCWDPKFDATHVGVTAVQVTLGGSVDWQSQRRHVEKQVGYVAGVRTIFNEIKLRPQTCADDIVAGIERALERNAEFEAERVSVSVDGGTVTLGGTVKALYERGLIEMAAWSAPGVHDVVNDIRVA